MVHRGASRGIAGATEDALAEILGLLHERTGHDFRDYKEATVVQRVERRIRIHQLSDVSNYVKLLRAEPHELDLLLETLLIAVTRFFRDPDAFAALGRALTDYLDKLPENVSLRLWVPGCSTGEEAYSLVIMLLDHAERAGRKLEVQAFATDLDARAIERARTGRYDASIAPVVEPGLLARFFLREGDTYRVHPRVRECLVFAVHNMLCDAPFTKLDLVSCRNVLLYMVEDLQSRMFRLFHFALRAQGLLWLGASETAAHRPDLFSARNARWRVYRRREVPTGLPLAESLARAAALEDDRARKPRESDLAVGLLEDSAAASMVVDRRGAIVDVHEALGNAGGSCPNARAANFINLAGFELRSKLELALHRASLAEGEIVQRGIRVTPERTYALTTLSVRHIAEPEALRGLFHVHWSVSAVDSPELTPTDMSPNLGQTLCELVVANEELQATNEELQATNEELRAANEGLETLRDEVRSLAAKLESRSTELHKQLDELGRVNVDLQGLLDATDVAMLLLDRQMRIKRFNSPARRLFRVRACDVRRPLSDLVLQGYGSELITHAEVVLASARPHDLDSIHLDGLRQHVRISPYWAKGSEMDGILITCSDADAQKCMSTTDESIV